MTHGHGSRIEPPPGVRRGRPVRVSVDGRDLECHLGESIAAALIASGGDLAIRTTSDGERRGLFCGMGVCFECLVEVDGVPGVRSCVTWVADGMAVRTQTGPGSAL